jgi:hypothetical protein
MQMITATATPESAPNPKNSRYRRREQFAKAAPSTDRPNWLSVNSGRVTATGVLQRNGWKSSIGFFEG